MWSRTKSVSSWDCYTTSWSHFVIKWESTVYVLVTATYIKICPVLPNDAQYKTSSNFKTNGLQISLPYKLYIFTLKIQFLIERMGFKPRVAPVDGVAFFAYFSSTIFAASSYHILAFEKVITNDHHAYHPHSGTFIALRPGLYVFTWTISLFRQRYHAIELLVNNNVVISVYLNPVNILDGGVTGTVVVQVNQGDDVLVRTGVQFTGGFHQ